MGGFGSFDPIVNALRRGAPSLAAEYLLRDDPRAQQHRDFLRTEEWRLHLPEGAAVAERLSKFELPTESFSAPDGVYALYTFDWPGDSGAGKEAVPWLLDVQTGTATDWGSFAAGCERGILAARQWFYEQLGLVDIRGRWHVASTPLIGGAHKYPDVGESAGLAAALAFGRFLVGEAGRPEAKRVAATGRVIGDRVVGVENVEVKSRAFLRELPDVQTLYVPKANSGDVPERVRNAIDVVEVETVSAALTHYLGDPSPAWLAAIDLFEATDQVQKLEIDQEHQLAQVLASRILEQTGTGWEGSFEHAPARAVALSIDAITLTHWGETDKAVARFAELDQGIAATPEDIRAEIMTDNFKALLAAKRASAWIDKLDYRRAVAALEEVQERMEGLEVRPRVEAWGTYARALACAGDLDRAEEVSSRQLSIYLRPPFASWRSQAYCNRMDVLFRRVARGEEDRLEEISQLLETARKENAELPEQAAREQNEIYVDLWETRLCAAHGRFARAQELAGDLETSAGRFPTHYMRRFVDEALARAGLVDEGIGYLDAAVEGISPHCGPFERVVLMTCAAVSAAVRIRNDRDGWLERGRSFLELLRGWTQDFVTVPNDGDGPEVWLDVLEDALARLPY